MANKNGQLETGWEAPTPEQWEALPIEQKRKETEKCVNWRIRQMAAAFVKGTLTPETALARLDKLPELAPLRNKFTTFVAIAENQAAQIKAEAENPSPAAPPVQNYDDQVIARMKELDAELDDDFPQEHLDFLEGWVKQRITDRALEALNETFVRLKRRKLNYADIAGFALIHYKSVQENEGHSPHARFIAFSKSQGSVFNGEIQECHVRRVLELLQVLGFTTQLQKHNYQKHQAARYSVMDLPELEEAADEEIDPESASDN